MNLSAEDDKVNSVISLCLRSGTSSQSVPELKELFHSCCFMSSPKILNLEQPKAAEDWTIVLPRRGKQKRNFDKIIVSEECKQVQAWVPTDLEWEPQREEKLMQIVNSYIKKLERSKFCEAFLDQVQTPEMTEEFLRVRGSEDKIQMVMYGIGSIESFESPRLQLSLAILMRRRFNWIGAIEVFDPIISLTESKVLEAFGFSVLSINEQGRRQASKPTLFFMPHCDAELYDNLLLANWRAYLLNQIVLFGNSFSEYERMASFCHNPSLADTRKHICAIQRFTKEYAISTVEDDYFRAFNNSSWHFFNLDCEALSQTFKS